MSITMGDMGDFVREGFDGRRRIFSRLEILAPLRGAIRLGRSFPPVFYRGLRSVVATRRGGTCGFEFRILGQRTDSRTLTICANIIARGETARGVVGVRDEPECRSAALQRPEAVATIGGTTAARNELQFSSRA